MPGSGTRWVVEKSLTCPQKKVKQTSFPDIAQSAMRIHQEEADGLSSLKLSGPWPLLGVYVEVPITSTLTGDFGDADSYQFNAA